MPPSRKPPKPAEPDGLAGRAMRVRSAEVALPAFRKAITGAEALEALKRSRRRRGLTPREA